MTLDGRHALRDAVIELGTDPGDTRDPDPRPLVSPDDRRVGFDDRVTRRNYPLESQTLLLVNRRHYRWCIAHALNGAA